jgi:hypothetical protein
MSAHTCVVAGTVQPHLAKIAHGSDGTGRLQARMYRVGGHLQSAALMCPTNSAAACATDARCIRTLYCRCMRRGRGGAFDPLYLSHETTGAHSSNTTPPPPTGSRTLNESTAATAKRQPQLKSRFSFQKLEAAATFATPGIYTFSCVQHLTLFNKV